MGLKEAWIKEGILAVNGADGETMWSSAFKSLSTGIERILLGTLLHEGKERFYAYARECGYTPKKILDKHNLDEEGMPYVDE